MSEPISLKCHRCGYKWKYKGKSYRTNCPRCKRKDKKNVWVKTGITAPKTSSIQENIMNGSILKAMDQMGIDPLKKMALGDCILYVLDDDNLILALNKAGRKMKKKPVILIRKAVKLFLKQEGFL